MPTFSNFLRRPVSLRHVDRPSVRALVEEDVAHLSRARAAGRDVQQLGSQRRDQIDRFVRTLHPSEGMTFLNLYQEEITSVYKAIALKNINHNILAPKALKISYLIIAFIILAIALAFAFAFAFYLTFICLD